MHQYLHTVDLVKRLGVHKGDRTGTGTQSRFGHQERYSLRNNRIPVITTKKIHLASIIHELFWMLSGDTKVDYLIANGARIWNEWVKPETAVYQDLTYEETEKAILKFVGGRYHVNFHAIEDRPGAEIIHINDYQERFNAAPPNLDEGIELILSVNTRCYGKHRGEVEHLDYAAQFMYIIHSMLIGKPHKLIGGDLGAVYGKTWRDIEDTRVVMKCDWVDYEARGFDFVVDIPGTSMETDRCVVTRRIDQIQDIIDQLRENPDSRRIIVCAWAPQLVDEQALPPCHSFFQFWTRELTLEERIELFQKEVDAGNYLKADDGQVLFNTEELIRVEMLQWNSENTHPVGDWLTEMGIPERALSCQLYQR